MTNDRGEDGELRLGIRRAAQLKNCSNFASISGQQLNLGSLTDIVNALSTRCAFSIHYNPRYFYGYSLRRSLVVRERGIVRFYLQFLECNIFNAFTIFFIGLVHLSSSYLSTNS